MTYSLPSFLQSVRWSVSSGGSDKTNHSVSVYLQPHNVEITKIKPRHTIQCYTRLTEGDT